MLPTIGQRIELVDMPDDPDPVPAGTQGTIDHVSGPHKLPGDRVAWHQVGVKWDNGRTLALLTTKDRWRVLGSPGDFLTTCPKGHRLYLKRATIIPHGQGIPITASGFDLNHDVDTEDEVVTCGQPGCPDAALQTVA